MTTPTTVTILVRGDRILAKRADAPRVSLSLVAAVKLVDKHNGTIGIEEGDVFEVVEAGKAEP